MADVTGKLPQANEMLQKVTATQLQRGAKRSEVRVEGCPDVVIRFDLPVPEEEKEARQSTLRGSEKSEAAKAEAASKAAAGGRAGGRFGPSGVLLPDGKSAGRGRQFRGAQRHLGSGRRSSKRQPGRPQGLPNGHAALQDGWRGEGLPQIRWFIHPLGYAEAARAATPADRRRKGKSILEVLRNQGIGAVKGVGGFLDFAAEGYEMVHRTAVYAPLPYEKSMKMLVLPNGDDLAPQPWVPRDIATYTTLYFDIANAFENFGSLFDEAVRPGRPGRVGGREAKPKGRPQRTANRSSRRT